MPKAGKPRRSTRPFGHEVAAQEIDGSRVVVSGAYSLPRRFRARVDDAEVPAVVTLTISVDDDGKSRCEEASISARPGEQVTATMLRDIPLLRLTRLAASAVRESPEGDGSYEEHRSFVRHFEKPKPPRRGHLYDQAHYERIAQVCEDAEQNGRSAVNDVMGAFFFAKSTAYAHIAQARRLAEGLRVPAE